MEELLLESKLELLWTIDEPPVINGYSLFVFDKEIKLYGRDKDLIGIVVPKDFLDFEFSYYDCEDDFLGTPVVNISADLGESYEFHPCHEYEVYVDDYTWGFLCLGRYHVHWDKLKGFEVQIYQNQRKEIIWFFKRLR